MSHSTSANGCPNCSTTAACILCAMINSSFKPEQSIGHIVEQVAMLRLFNSAQFRKTREDQPLRQSCLGELRRKELLVVKDDIKQRAVDLQTAVVVNKSQFPEPIHEETDTRASCAHHLCEGLLTDFGDYSPGFAVPAKMGEQ